MKTSQLQSRLAKVYNWVMGLDYSSPITILSICGIIILPFIAKYLVLTAIIMAICLAISMLLIVDTLPRKIKNIIFNYPTISNIVLTLLATVTIGPYMGTGLTITLAAIFTDVILEITTPIITRPEVEQQPA